MSQWLSDPKLVLEAEKIKKLAELKTVAASEFGEESPQVRGPRQQYFAQAASHMCPLGRASIGEWKPSIARRDKLRVTCSSKRACPSGRCWCGSGE